MNSIILYSVIVAVVLNLVLPKFIMSYATPKEMKASKGVEDLSLKEQIMHMFVHHANTPLSSSIVIAVIVYLSVFIGCQFSKSGGKKGK